MIYEETYSACGNLVTALDSDLTTLTPTSKAEYVFANGQRVAKLVPGTDPSGHLSGEVATYYHQDHLGSTRLMTDSLGNPVAQMDYEPFGAQMLGSYGGEPIHAPFWFGRKSPGQRQRPEGEVR